MCRKYLENETEKRDFFYSGAQLLSPYNKRERERREN